MTSDTQQRVLITAGASGIGRAMGEAFAEAGARVWVTDVDDTALATVPADWGATRADVVDEDAMAALIGEIDAVWGGLDTLCANAGIAGPTAGIDEIGYDDWRRCLGVNLDGAFLACKHGVPLLKRQGAGSIILTSSTAGLGGIVRRAPYVAAKWAVIGLMKTLAIELGDSGIRANAICPGAVNGPRMDGVIAREARARNMAEDEIRASYAVGAAMRSFVDAADVAAMAVFLASPAARFVSGQVIAVDGFTVNFDT